MFRWLRDRRRKKLLDDPFPVWWESILKRNVGHYLRVSPAEQAAMRDVTRILVAEKKWVGCNGMQITEEVKVTIAAQASIPILAADHDYYARVQSVLVYPTEFRTPNPEDDYEDDELSDTVLDGQAWYRGPVIVSWKEAVEEGRDPECGQNVVIHEFVHQIDYLDYDANGAPPIKDRDLARRWQATMSVAYKEHTAELDRGERETFFSEHAGDSETEFFADAAEAFFCSPAGLKEECPDVYAVFAEYFRLDPVRWFP
jgi:Mlc titration factor MtfA (ptsG expression regulator)